MGHRRNTSEHTLSTESSGDDVEGQGGLGQQEALRVAHRVLHEQRLSKPERAAHDDALGRHGRSDRRECHADSCGRVPDQALGLPVASHCRFEDDRRVDSGAAAVDAARPDRTRPTCDSVAAGE